MAQQFQSDADGVAGLSGASGLQSTMGAQRSGFHCQLRSAQQQTLWTRQ